MANTKLTKRKDREDSTEVESSSDSEPKLPQNQGNGDLVDDLSHVHSKCDDLMAKLKALNQAALDMPTASAAVSTSPFVSPIITPVQIETAGDVVEGGVTSAQVENINDVVEEILSEVAAAVDAVSDNLINYLTEENANPNVII